MISAVLLFRLFVLFVPSSFPSSAALLMIVGHWCDKMLVIYLFRFYFVRPYK